MTTKNKNNICVIIPAYNEEKSILSVIANLKKVFPRATIVVINDGSTDSTSAIAKKKVTTVIDLPLNLGIGGSVQTGLQYARDNNYSIAIQIDADGQHPPQEIPKLLAALSEKTDMVIGSRYIKKSGYKGSFHRTLGINFFSTLIYWVSGLKIYDPTSGFRAYNRRAIGYLADHYPIDFPEPESIVDLVKNNFVIKEVSVKMSARKAGRSSIRRFKAIYFVISITIGIILSSLKRKHKHAELLR